MERGAPLGADREGQGGLGEDRRHHRLVHHHGESEIAGEAHADAADAGAAAFRVGLPGEGAQPVGDGARRVRCQYVELPRDAGASDRLEDVPVREGAAGGARELGQVDPVTRRDESVGELDDLRVDPRDLVHHDDAPPRPGDEEASPQSLVLEGRLFVSVEHLALLSRSRRGRRRRPRSTLRRSWADPGPPLPPSCVSRAPRPPLSACIRVESSTRA